MVYLKKILLAPIFLVVAPTSLFADQVFNIQLLGFSSNGNYAACYQYVQATESNWWFGSIRVLEIKTNTIVASVEAGREYDWEKYNRKPGEYQLAGKVISDDLLKRLLVKKDVLKPYKIVMGNTGYLAYYRAIWPMPQDSCLSHTPEFSVECASTMSPVQSYRLRLQQCIPFPENDSAFKRRLQPDGSHHGSLFELKLLVSGQSYDIFTTQDASGIADYPLQYTVGRVYFYGEKSMLIFVHYTVEAIEGPHVKTLVIGANLDRLQ